MSGRRVLGMLALGVACVGCRSASEPTERRASGYVEATEVRIAAKVAGRVRAVNAVEGARVGAGDLLVTLSTTDTDLATDRAMAERAQADAQLRLLRAGSRPEDISQAEAQVAAASADRRAAESELAAAKTDEARYEQLVQKRAGTVKQRDDAVARRELAEARVRAAADRAAAASATLSRLRAGARAEELDAARARVDAIDAELAVLKDRRVEATITAPSAGIVTSRLVEPGELVAVGAPAGRAHGPRPRVGERVRRRDRGAHAEDRAAGHDCDGCRRQDARSGRRHRATRGVHAQERSDGDRTRQARLPREGHRGEQQRDSEAGHAGRRRARDGGGVMNRRGHRDRRRAQVIWFDRRARRRHVRCSDG